MFRRAPMAVIFDADANNLLGLTQHGTSPLSREIRDAPLQAVFFFMMANCCLYCRNHSCYIFVICQSDFLTWNSFMNFLPKYLHPFIGCFLHKSIWLILFWKYRFLILIERAWSIHIRALELGSTTPSITWSLHRRFSPWLIECTIGCLASVLLIDLSPWLDLATTNNLSTFFLPKVI